MADTSLIFNLVARDNATKTMDKLSGKMKLVGIAAGAMALKFGKDSVNAFVEAEESQKKLQFAFDKFPALADTNIEALRTLNTTWAKKTKFDDDNIASGQAVLAQFKLTGTQLKQVTPLLLDYASKTGKDIPAAAMDVGKALLGNAKALKNIGITYKSTGNATQDYTNITALMREKVGGFATLEGKTAAGQAAILKNQFGELEESVGARLVPALSKLATELLAVVGFVSRNQAVIGPLVVGLGGLVLAVKGVNTAVAASKATQAAFNTVLGRTATTATGAAANTGRLGKVLSSGGVWGLAVIGAVGILGLLAKKHADAKARVDDLTQAIQADSGALAENTHVSAANALEKSGALKAAQALGIGLGTLTDAYLGLPGAVAEVQTAVDRQTATLPTGRITDWSDAESKLSGNLAIVTNAIHTGNTATDAAVAKAKRLSAASGKVADAQTDQADATSDAADAADDASAKVETYADALNRLNGVNITAEQQQIALKKAFISTKGAIDSSKKVTLDERSALLDLAGQSNSTAAAVEEQTGSQRKANQVMREARGKFVDTAVAMGMSKDAAKALADKLLAIPTRKKSVVSVSGVTTATAQVAALNAELRKAGGHVSINGVGTGTTANAGGTLNWGGGLSLVGEQGPEIVEIPKHANIYSNAKSRQMMGSPRGGRQSGVASGGGTTINIYIPAKVIGSKEDVVRWVRAGLDDIARRRGEPLLAPAR